MGSYRLLALLVFITGGSFAQSRYVVHFKDKNGSPYSVNAPGAFLSQRAIQRRVEQNISITTADLPVNASYVQQVSATGARSFFTSRWFNCVLVQADAAQETAIRSLPFVSSVEFVAPGAHAGAGRVRSYKNKKGSGIAAPTMTQLSMVGIDSMHLEDVRGNGVLVAVLDAGFPGVNTGDPFKHLFENQQIQYTYDFVGAGTDVFKYDEHGTEVFSVIAGHSSGYTGGAYDATFQLYVTEDAPTEYRVEEYNWLFAAERADSSGVDVITASLGYNTFDDAAMDYEKSELNGLTSVVSRAAVAAIDRGIVVVCSAGNEGGNSWGLVTPPADVNGILAVGSVTSAGVRSSFSSVGPTADGRVKPDVVAMGSGTTVVKPNGTVGNASGTSLAAPIITSLAIGLLQRFPSLTAAQVVDAIIDNGSLTANPNNQLGHGIPYYMRIVRSLTPYYAGEPISVFPNPAADGRFHVLVSEVDQDVQVEIFDLRGTRLGNHMVNVTWENNPFEFDITSLSAGSYLVRVRTKDNFKTTVLVRP
jgi:serine protease AprX